MSAPIENFTKQLKLMCIDVYGGYGKVQSKKIEGYASDILNKMETVADEREQEWQKMCNKFVGCSMLSDEFADELHEPEIFGLYIQNLIDQIKKLKKF